MFELVQTILKLTLVRKMQQILDWLSPHEFQLKRRSLVQQHVPGTGQWLVEEPEFRDWENGKSSKILWCKGERNNLKISMNR